MTGIDLRRSRGAIDPWKAAAKRMNGLDCRRCKLSEQFDQVGASMHATEASAQVGTKSGLDAQTEQSLEVRRHRGAYPMWPRIDTGVDTVDQQRVVDGDAKRHVMKQTTGVDRSMIVVNGVALSVRHSCFDVPQAVGPAVAATHDLTGVDRRAWSSRW